jgi:nucleoside-diphosphate-sugar epimerase
MSRILITGATGFVGRALVPVLQRQHEVLAAIRRGGSPGLPSGVAWHKVGEIGPETDWSTALRDVDAIVHLAAHVHQSDATADPADFHRINSAGTRHLAEAARRAGVARLVFLSSVKVNGEATGRDAFREDDAPRPEGPYAQSKWAAEQALAEIATAGGAATIILRPPLVYGPGAKANFRALMRLCRLGVPLPLGAVDNRRSLLYLGNLVAAIERALAEPAVGVCRTYLLRDGEDVSTADLVRRLGAALDRPARLVKVPKSWLRLALRLIGRGSAADRLLGSLTVDDSRFRRDFAWRPPYTVEQGLAVTVDAFRREAGG